MSKKVDNIVVCARLIDAWAAALRGNWGDINGRQCQMQLDHVSALLRNKDLAAVFEEELPHIGVRRNEWGGFEWDE